MNCRDSSRESNPNTELFSHVPQAGMDWVVLESLMYQYWKPDTITAERKRIRQTWFDYRHIHPVLRSFVFVCEYNLAHQRAYKRFYGEPEQPFEDLPRGWRTPLYKRSQRNIRLTVLKMHLIDEMGCPYDTFFDAAFEHFMQERSFLSWDWRKTGRYREPLKLPPLTVLADGRGLISAQKAFEKKNGIKIRLPKHPHYKASNWCGTVSQKECAKYLIDQVKSRGDRNIGLARLAYELDLLRENEVVKYLSLDAVKQMRAIKHTI